MKQKALVIGLILAVAVGGGLCYRIMQTNSGTEQAEHTEAVQKKEKGDGHVGHGDEGTVRMSAELQKLNGVTVGPAKRERLAGVISATGKVEANADRIAHVSPRIAGTIVSVTSSLGDSVAAGQVLVTLDSVELGDALNRYHQSRTRLALAQVSMERVRSLVEKKIAARKDILQAETDYTTAQTELHTAEERLSLFGVNLSQIKSGDHTRPLLPVRSPIAGIITEKHAIVGELADPSRSLYTIADLSSVWVMVDINEKDLARIHRGQTATVSVGAFPDLTLKGRITYIADLVEPGTRTVKARIEVPNAGRKLKPEMFATIELALAAAASPVLAVPDDALQELDGRKVLFVLEERDRFTPRPVETGRAASGMVEIVSGLKEGEPYALKGSFILKSELKKGEMTDEHGH